MSMWVWHQLVVVFGVVVCVVLVGVCCYVVIAEWGYDLFV